jgi:hypothetical protein
MCVDTLHTGDNDDNDDDDDDDNNNNTLCQEYGKFISLRSLTL